MSKAVHQRHNQGPHCNKVFNAYEQLQQTILDKTGVVCTILVKPGIVSIRTESLADFYLAKAAIKGMASGEIIRSI